MSRKRYGKFGPIVGAIDEGTSSARFMAFAAETSEVLTYHQMEVVQLYPQEGWVEQDPMAILQAVEECISKTTHNLIQLDIDPRDMVAIGVANQRETTVLWDKITGQPFYNAIGWLDSRTSVTAEAILSQDRRRNVDILKPLCGLPIDPYFSALKIKWLIDNVPEVRGAIEKNRCLFGTIDTWLIWNLTGGPQGGIHVTDVTNASRTMLMNLSTLSWDNRLLSFFSIPQNILPDIYSSSEIYGYIRQGVLRGVPISGCLGDQQAALVGQMCLQQGEAKNTYGTGSFLLYNTGRVMVESSHGLLTTVAYQLGRSAPPVYALEGSVAIAGASFKWLRDNIGLFQELGDTEHLVTSTSEDSDVTFVPAFTGLYAPYWRRDARGVICGVTNDTTKAQIVRAAMEAVCFQTRDIINAIKADCGIPLHKLLVDGGMTVNSCLMQLQADLAGIPVVRASISETTALGAAIVAGMAEGVKVWDVLTTPKIICDTFYPTITHNEREVRYQRWKSAIARSINWTQEEDSSKRIELTRRHGIINGPGLFIVFSIAFLIGARYFTSR